jgi:hypothetical protein
MVRQHLEAHHIEVTEDMLTTKAFLEVLAYKRRAKSLTKGRRLAKELCVERRWYVALAHEVTNYIDRYRKGFIWGKSLQDLYDEIAEALNAIEETDDLTPRDIEIAVNIAVGKELLRRKDANDTSAREWVCVNLSPAA